MSDRLKISTTGPLMPGRAANKKVAAYGDKDARFQQVAEAVVLTLLREGPEGLSFSNIARRADVSRPWLYKYLGNEKDSLLQHAALTFGEAFAEMDQRYRAKDTADWRRHLWEGSIQALHDSEANPWIMNLYFRYQNDSGILGDTISRISLRYHHKFVEEMPTKLKRNPARAERFAHIFVALRMGLYHRWTDADFRKIVSHEQAISGLFTMLDSYIVQNEQVQPGPWL